MGWTEKQRKKFYDSSAWQEKRIEILKRDHFECQECRKRIEKAREDSRTLPPDKRRIHRADCVHHILHLEDHPELALDDDNLEAICNQCHNEVHGRVLKHRFKPGKQRVTDEKW